MMVIHVCFTVAKILRVLKLRSKFRMTQECFTVAKILRVLKLKVSTARVDSGFTVAKILRVLKPWTFPGILKVVLQ